MSIQRSTRTVVCQIRHRWDASTLSVSNAPPTVALIKSANPNLTPTEIRHILTQTARPQNNFKTLDAQAATQQALHKKK